MYKLCKTESGALRQRQLAEQMRRMLCHQPYESITVSELCAQAGIRRNAFYRYFSCKEDILCALADLDIQEYEQDAGPYRAQEPRTLPKEMEKLFRVCRREKPLMDALARDGLLGVYFRHVTQRVFTTRNGTRHFTVQDTPERLRKATLFIISGLLALITDWLARGYPESEEEMARTAADLLARPLATPRFGP